MKKNIIINIGRQLGSGGREIGKKLSTRLHLKFYDKELISLASKESGLCKEFFEKVDEQAAPDFMCNFFSMHFPFMTEGMMAAPHCLSNDSLFKVQSDVIRHLAADHSCLFVGRCADYILRNHPDCLNVFISSSNEMRLERLCKQYKISEAEAQTLMEKADKNRSAYYNYYTDQTWGAAATYHLCIDSSLLGIDETVDLIEQIARKKFGE